MNRTPGARRRRCWMRAQKGEKIGNGLDRGRDADGVREAAQVHRQGMDRNRIEARSLLRIASLTRAPRPLDLQAIKSLVSSEREDVAYCLRLQKGRVYYVREDLMRRATNVARDKLVGLGVCIGKFTHGGKFRLTVGSLDVLAKHAKYKVR